MKSILVSLLFFFWGCSSLSQYSQSQTFLPISDPVIEHLAYWVGYDGSRRQPRWVYEGLDKTHLEKKVSRKGISFLPDPLLPEILSATDADYRGSGFDRGHLSPAANALYDLRALRETFYFSNVSPQERSFNRGIWKKLEERVRSVVLQYDFIHVYTGPLYLPHREADNRNYVTYQVIGSRHVAVPTHYFKVFFTKEGKLIEAYILPNKTIAKPTSLEQFLTSLDKVEQLAGILFPFK